MMSDPLTQSSSKPVHMYEYGEYDGLVDLDAVLHGAATTTTMSATVNDGAAAPSPTPNLSCLVGSEETGTYSSYQNVQGRNNHLNSHNNNDSGELGPTPSPHGRSPARKPMRDPVARGSLASSADRYPGAHGSNSSAPRSNGGYPMTLDEGDAAVSTAPTTTTVTATAATAAAPPGSRGGQRKRGESANGLRNNNNNNNNQSHATTTTTTTQTHSSDTGVHLPVILPSQQRRPADTMPPSRVRVSPLTQEHTAAAAGLTFNTATPINARSAASVSPMAQNTRPIGAKTVMSASNLAALQRSGNDRVHTGALSTGNSSNKVPPYLAPPLTPLHTRANPLLPTTAPTPAPHRLAAEASTKRGESSESASASAPHTSGAEKTSSARPSNGWVREEARRIDRTSQEMSPGFPQERLRQTSPSSGATSSVETGQTTAEATGSGGHATTGGRGKTNTSPAPSTAPRAPVWANDYETGRNDLVGCTTTTTTDFGAMPKVAAPPLPQRARKTLSDSCKKSPAFRPPPHVPSTPPAGKLTSPVESVILPLRTVAQRAARPSNANAAAVAAAADSGVGTASKPNPATDAASGPHTPGTTHRRVMNAVDTHAGTPSDLSADRRATPIIVAVNSGKTVPGAREHASSLAKASMPYADDRRAALEAWAAFPALDVTIRHQSPTAAQLRRERDIAASRPSAARQLYPAVKGQAPQEFAGEPFEMNYDVHNVVVQLRHRNRPLMLAYPPQLPLELDTRPRLRRQRTPRSFYGRRFPHVGDAWFRSALDDAQHIESPDIEAMEKREEEEFVRNGGDPAQRRNRYGQANNNTNNNNNNQHAQNQNAPRAPPHSGAGAPNIEQMNRNVVRMEQPAA